MTNKDLFGKEIVKQQVMFDREILTHALYAIFKDITIEELVMLITNEVEEILEYYKLLNGNRACQKTSLLYNPHRLSTKSYSSKKSLFEAIHDKSFCSGLARAVNFKNGKVKELLYQVLQLGINGVQYINEFPPHVARKIYLDYYINSTSKILDPCAGWGGRMLGASVVCNSYTAFEPSTKTYTGLLALNKFITRLNPSFTSEIYNLPFEESHLSQGTYDFALTSPPYFDTECYTTETTNSMNKFSTFDLWCHGFFFPLIHKTMNALKPNGVFVLNIGSRKYPLNEKLQELKHQYIITKLGNQLSGSCGLGKQGEGEMFYEIKKNSTKIRKSRRVSAKGHYDK